MTIAALLPPRLGKEVRGLLPVWLACLVPMLGGAALGGRGQAIGLAAYFLGAAALGALSIGQEYNSHTLTLMLSQPVERKRLWLEKLGVLLALLLVLAAASLLNVFDVTSPYDSASQAVRGMLTTSGWWTVLFFLPALAGLLIAPWMTMVCRNALAGIVFTMAIAAAMWGVSDLTASIVYTAELSQIPDARHLALEFFWRGMLIVGVAGAVFGWRMFMRLEAVETRGLQVSWPAWLPGRPAQQMDVVASSGVRQSAVWLLFKKEVHLQHLTLAVSGLYVLGWIAVLVVQPVSVPTKLTLLYALTVFHSGAIPLLAGALASASEREMGTLGWHVLLPMSGWKQWWVKVSVALGTALVLTFGLPTLLLAIHSTPAIRGEIVPITPTAFAYAVVLIVLATLYVSSLCANALRAVLTSLPVALLAVAFLSPQSRRWYVEIPRTLRRLPRLFAYASSGEDSLLFQKEFIYGLLTTGLSVTMYVGLIGLLLALALRNHRQADQSARRVGRQTFALGLFLVFGAALGYGISQSYAAEMEPLYRARDAEWYARFGTVTGVAVNAAGQRVNSYTVVLFSDDKRLRQPESFERANFFESNALGVFRTWRTTNPGSYLVVATEKLNRSDQVDQTLLRQLRPNAVPVTIEASKTITMDVPFVTRSEINK